MRKIVLLSSFFMLTPVFLFFTILYFLFLSYGHKNNTQFLLNSKVNPISFAALPSFENSLRNQIGQKDVRIEIVGQFFKRYNSPLLPYTKDVVLTADKYDIDFRLLPAIAMQESNLCLKAPKNSNNCWGFGIYGKKMTKFSDYKQAIDTVTKTLAKDYIGRGLDTPEEIMKKYTPSNNGAWAASVNYFMNRLQ